MHNFCQGGESTSQEMCVSFLLYYPRIDVEMCLSMPIYNNIDRDYNKVFGKIQAMDFSRKSVRDDFVRKLNETYYTTMCIGRNLHPNVSDVNQTKNTSIRHTLRFPITCLYSNFRFRLYPSLVSCIYNDSITMHLPQSVFDLVNMIGENKV